METYIQINYEFDKLILESERMETTLFVDSHSFIFSPVLEGITEIEISNEELDNNPLSRRNVNKANDKGDTHTNNMQQTDAAKITRFKKIMTAFINKVQQMLMLIRRTFMRLFNDNKKFISSVEARLKNVDPRKTVTVEEFAYHIQFKSAIFDRLEVKVLSALDLIETYMSHDFKDAADPRDLIKTSNFMNDIIKELNLPADTVPTAAGICSAITILYRGEKRERTYIIQDANDLLKIIPVLSENESALNKSLDNVHNVAKKMTGTLLHRQPTSGKSVSEIHAVVNQSMKLITEICKIKNHCMLLLNERIIMVKRLIGLFLSTTDEKHSTSTPKQNKQTEETSTKK